MSEKPRRLPAVLSVLALVISAIAVGISVYPYVNSGAEQSANAQSYVRALVSNGLSGPLEARSYAVEGSNADSFAKFVSDVWKAYVPEPSQHKVPSGTVTSIGAGDYRACFPKIRVSIFGGKHVDVGQFEYGQADQVTRFDVNRIPIDSLLVGAAPAEMSEDSDGGPVRIYSYGALYPAGKGDKLILLWLERNHTKDDQQTVDFQKVLAENPAEFSAHVQAWSIPDSLTYWSSGFATVSVPVNTEFLYLCWNDLPNSPYGCDWGYDAP